MRLLFAGYPVSFSLLKWRILTSLPAILLCRFIIIRAGFPVRPRSLASTNFVENSIPYSMSSLHPAHFQPSSASPVYFWSHPHFRPSLPALHECVTAYATPAEEMEWTNAASLVPSKLKTKTTTKKILINVIKFYQNSQVEELPLQANKKLGKNTASCLRLEWGSYNIDNLVFLVCTCI